MCQSRYPRRLLQKGLTIFIFHYDRPKNLPCRNEDQKNQYKRANNLNIFNIPLF